MSLFGTLRTGASGLGVSGAALGVIGDNIANLNTVGFKRNRIQFADMIPEDVFGLGPGPAQLGRGATNLSVNPLFTQGAVQGTSSSLDMAISGQGWFAVANGNETFYSRDGSFGVDPDGFLINQMGFRVQGYQAEFGEISPVLSDLVIYDMPAPPAMTTTITAELTLDPSTDPDATEDYTLLSLDGASVPLREAAEAADFSTSVTVYDSLGRQHELILNFERDRADPTQWSYSVVIDAGETDLAGAQEGMALEIGTGQLGFDADGQLITNGFTVNNTPWTWPGASPFDPTFEFGVDAAGNPTSGSVTNNGAENVVSAISQDGYGNGNLTDISVDQDGVIYGQYTNGAQLALGQVAVATFEAEGGLERMGGNMFRATFASGAATLGQANAGGRGRVDGYSLERSNVDLEREFVSMIQIQRSYQANAGVIRTADETLQELVNLV
ncbi:MAG: flagellar hook protein FlgE [Myxococcota bacterium]